MDVLSIVLGIGTALGGGGTVAYWRETHSLGLRKKRTEEIDGRVKESIAPVQADLAGIHAKLDSMAEHHDAKVAAVLHTAMEPVRDQLAILNTKVEPLWTALINMGLNQTNVLHQPDPRRAEIDGLLEKLQDELREGQLMSAEDYMKLRGFLEQIKAYEPGQVLPFPVLPAEPTSAAILLAIMGLSRVRRRHGSNHR